MKLKDLIKKIDGDVAIHINGKRLTGELIEGLQDTEISKVDIETKKETSKNLEELGFSFEVGV
ncbi:MAG: hypothetical protein Q7I98_04630 [Erysipelotrichaceae bacterium]|nr:hypothetical protein [Erysipelotrichaceae bacterium]